jgi:hypothetical protein
MLEIPAEMICGHAFKDLPFNHRINLHGKEKKTHVAQTTPSSHTKYKH